MTLRTLSPFPPPPDIERIAPPANPYAPVVFRESLFGRATAWLGAIMIGEVAPNHGGRMQKACVLLYLPEVPRKVLPASSMTAAKEILARETRQWIEAAGLRA